MKKALTLEDCHGFGLGVVEIGLAFDASSLYLEDVVDHGGFVDVVESAQVDLLTFDHGQNLPV